MSKIPLENSSIKRKDIHDPYFYDWKKMKNKEKFILLSTICKIFKKERISSLMLNNFHVSE